MKMWLISFFSYAHQCGDDVGGWDELETNEFNLTHWTDKWMESSQWLRGHVGEIFGVAFVVRIFVYLCKVSKITQIVNKTFWFMYRERFSHRLFAFSFYK